ncbi:MAG TPA: DUF2490 domain-containing protein [Gemmatimonadales bacterium]|nr:DUF2490 domain-containing protein [Gemmatimonadales bacterium]
MRTIARLLVLGCLVAPRAGGQQHDIQSWTLLTAQVGLADRGRSFLYLEGQARVGDDVSQLERLLLRPAVGRQLSRDIAVSLGYAWTPTFIDTRYEEAFRGEHRLWQQLFARHGTGRLAWQHRLRQEQRLLDDAGGTSHRTRYLARASYALGGQRRRGITGYHELFWTWNSVDRGPQSGFDRSRVFLGPYLVRPGVRYEVGYVGEYGKRFGPSDRMVHALLLSANLTF